MVMSKNSLPSELLKLLVDPYAVLGVSIKADESLIAKRYYALAKRFHPDNINIKNSSDRELASQILARLINPAYEQLKFEKRRNEVLATLRLKASTLSKKDVTILQNDINMDMAEMSIPEMELFYEQALAAYMKPQYKSLKRFKRFTKRITQLNLFFLYFQNQVLKKTEPEPEIISSSTSLVPIETPNVINLNIPESQESDKTKPESQAIKYAQRHYDRAVQYQQQGQLSLAVREMRDAIKIEPNNSDNYALLGVIHFQQNFPGMAKVYIRQALKINPTHPVAVKYAKLLNIELENTSNPKSISKALGIASLLSRFFSRK